MSARRAFAALAVCGAFFVGYLVSFPRAWSGHQIQQSAHDNVDYVLAERFAQGHGFRAPLRHHEALPPDIAAALTPRDSASRDGQAVPKDFVGPLLLYGLAFALGKWAVLVLSPLLAAVSGLAVARFARDLFPELDARAARWSGAAAGLLWLAWPPLFVNASYIVSPDPLNATFAVLAAGAFVRYRREGRVGDFVRMSLALGALVLFRYANVLLALPLGLALLVGRRLPPRRALLGAALAAPFAAAILVFDRVLYGSWTTTGYHIGDRLLRETANFEGSGLVQFDPQVAASYLRFYGLRWATILAVPLVGALYAVRVARADRGNRGVLAALLVTTGVFFAYHIGFDALGSTRAQVNASMPRYLFPAAALWLAFLGIGIVREAGARRGLAAGVLAAIVVASLGTAYAAPSGVRQRGPGVARLARLRAAVLAATEPDALVATSALDRVIWPDRQTLTLTYLLRNERPIPKRGERGWDVVPDGVRFADVADRVLARGIPLYLLADIPSDRVTQYVRASAGRGLRLDLIASPEDGAPLYRVVRAPG